MNVSQNTKNCTGCGACANICPKKAVQMVPDQKGFLFPHIDETSCVDCGLCSAACPVLSFHSTSGPQYPSAYAAHNRNSEIVEHSSSGGVFSALAEKTITQGGVVYGAEFQAGQHVAHSRIDSIEYLNRLRGSKYVQSSIGDCYALAKRDLHSGKKVLFSGTPCQIAGLKQYLGQEYDNLLCVDTICHSVPSPMVWQEYLRQLADQEQQVISHVNFRDKRVSWKKYCLCVTMSSGKEVLYSCGSNQYMRAFIQGLSTRESCYNCPFKGQNRGSDITLGDFWGVEATNPHEFYERGTSLILVQSEKGEIALSAVSSELDLCQVDAQTALQGNPAYMLPAKPHPRRALFFARLHQTNFDDLVNELLLPSKKEVAVQKIKQSFLYRGAQKIIRRLRK